MGNRLGLLPCSVVCEPRTCLLVHFISSLTLDYTLLILTPDTYLSRRGRKSPKSIPVMIVDRIDGGDRLPDDNNASEASG